jgi:hypothetical protein
LPEVNSLQACPEILAGCADELIASEVPYDGFLVASPDDVSCLKSILPLQLKHELPDSRCSRRLQEPHQVQIGCVDRAQYHSDERFARGQRRVGISSTFNTFFGSPVSGKINAMINTSWLFREWLIWARMFPSFG